MVDLHAHSTASDGSYSPSRVVGLAHERGLSALSLTDHDTVSGLAEASARAGELGIAFVPGIELDIEWKPGECHLLGYGIKAPYPVLEPLLVKLIESRKERNREIAARMNEAGITVDLARIEELAGGGTVGRPHFAQYLVETKAVRNRQQAFDRYLAKDRPYYVDRKSVRLDEGIAAIAAACGIPVLAHPLSLYVSWGHMKEVLVKFRDMGIRGIEAWHPGARIVECERLEALARELGLFVTAGSDFHGEARPERRLGRTAGRRDIDDRFYRDSLEGLIER